MNPACLGVIASEANTPPINLDKVKVSEEVAQIIPVDVASSYGVVPLDKIGDYLTIAVVNPFDVLKLDDIRIITGCELRPVVALEGQLHSFLKRAYQSAEAKVDEMIGGFDDEDVEMAGSEDEDEAGELDMAKTSDEAAPVVKLINKIVHDAVTTKVSDIHIEPFEKTVIVRYRKDGSLNKVIEPPKRMQNAMVSRIKIMAKLDIAEKRKPQDGKFQMRLGHKKIDFRVSTLPVVWGEKVVMRILDSSNLSLDINDLGFEDKCMEDYLWACDQPYGMILVTGPTGSGKSTTLYSAIAHIAEPEINIVTVEDPVEYTMEGINQVPISNARGLTFAAALRSILRQDPDVILLGEIRDKETIEIATKAALTGHLVLSTLHTNDAPSTITRMVDMGLDPFMVASSTLVICAQRLAKRLCATCKEPYEIPKRAASPARPARVGFREARGADLPPEGLRQVRQRLQGPFRAARNAQALRGRQAPGDPGRLRHGAQETRDPQGRHDHAAACRPLERDSRRDFGRRSPALHDGRLSRFRARSHPLRSRKENSRFETHPELLGIGCSSRRSSAERALLPALQLANLARRYRIKSGLKTSPPSGRLIARDCIRKRRTSG